MIGNAARQRLTASISTDETTKDETSLLFSENWRSQWPSFQSGFVESRRDKNLDRSNQNGATPCIH